MGELTSFSLAVSIIRAIGFLSRSNLKFRPPMLVLHGGNDCYINTKAVKKFVKRANCSDISLKIIAEGYHELYLDKEKELLFSKILEWIKGHLDGGNHSRGYKNYAFRTRIDYSRKINTHRLKVVIILYLIGMLL